MNDKVVNFDKKQSPTWRELYEETMEFAKELQAKLLAAREENLQLQGQITRDQRALASIHATVSDMLDPERRVGPK